MTHWRMGDTAQDYKVANSQAADWARGKFEKQIEAGRESAVQTINTIVNTVPQDALVAGRALTFQPSETDVQVLFGDGAEPKPIHDNAFRQMCSKAGLPLKFGDALRTGEEWERELLAHNLTEIHNRQDRRHFMRSVKGEVRACLSDRYAPYNSPEIVDAIVGEFQKLGVVPLSCRATDTRWSLKGVLPMVFEPFADEIMTYGLDIQNSDYGNGAFHVRLFGNRVMCTNLMTTEDGLRKVHLGGRLSDDFTFSQETYQLNSAALISATKDTVAGLLGPGKIDEMNQVIVEAHESSLSWAAAKRKLGKLTKTETEKVQEAFEGNDVMNLPPNETRWRLSNAISWLGVNTENQDRALDLQRIAGEVIGK